ncbi:MAG: GIY-YIG nuclease family protein [Akkermansia sp.]|nr:GIY-YIG nuclease family protein [Akkermansia sp.]
MPTSHFHYVYILWDASTHSHFYVGHTSDLAARLKTHNAGHVPHTSKFTPWERASVRNLKLNECYGNIIAWNSSGNESQNQFEDIVFSMLIFAHQNTPQHKYRSSKRNNRPKTKKR